MRSEERRPSDSILSHQRSISDRWASMVPVMTSSGPFAGIRQLGDHLGGQQRRQARELGHAGRHLVLRDTEAGGYGRRGIGLQDVVDQRPYVRLQKRGEWAGDEVANPGGMGHRTKRMQALVQRVTNNDAELRGGWLASVFLFERRAQVPEPDPPLHLQGVLNLLPAIQQGVLADRPEVLPHPVRRLTGPGGFGRPFAGGSIAAGILVLGVAPGHILSVWVPHLEIRTEHTARTFPGWGSLRRPCGAKRPPDRSTSDRGRRSVMTLVAGEGLEPSTFGL